MQHGAGGLDQSDGVEMINGTGPPWSCQHAAANDAHV